MLKPMKIIWVLVSCSNVKEADNIGRGILEERFASCFDIFSRYKTQYFWPPKTNRIETGRGCILILETLPKYFRKIEKLVKEMHGDELPFIASMEISVRSDYVNWMKGELK